MEKGAPFHETILRVSSLAVAGGITILLLASVLPPILADQTDRAIINAPVMLLTAPIEGEIDSLPPELGQYVNAQQVIAQISNNKVDRSTLVQLEERSQSTREKVAAAERKKDSDRNYLSALDKEIARIKTQLANQFQAQAAELQARVDEAVALSGEKKALVDQQSNMVSRNVLSPELLKRTSMSHSASVHASDAERARLTHKQVQMKALQEEIYVGDNFSPLPELAQKRRDIDLDATRMEIEQRELQAVVDGLDRLMHAERERMLSLSTANVTTPVSGKLLAVGAAAGRHVKAGDTLASLIDCDRRFVVAIFSYREAQNLAVGSRVRIEGAPFTSGTIKGIVPKTSDKLDERYAVPFPQTERRELYAIISPHQDLNDESEGPDRSETVGQTGDQGDRSCGVGQWVTVTRESGVVPSMSVTWSKMQKHVSSWFSRREEVTDAQRRGLRKLGAAFRKGMYPDLSTVGAHTNWLRNKTDVAFR